MKKTILKRTADILEKLGVAGLAVGLFHTNTSGMWLSLVFVGMSYIFSAWEAKQ